MLNRWLIVIAPLLLLSTVATGEQPPPGWQLLTSDDFEHGTKQWQIVDPQTWAVRKQQDGTHSLEITARESAYSPEHRSPLHIALLNDVVVDDFDLSFRVRSTLDTGDHRDCCVFFGYQDASHFYYAHLGAKPDPASGQIMIVDGAPRRPLTKNVQPVAWDDAWHVVKLERRLADGSIRVYFDDLEKPLMEARDTTFGRGRIGIGSFDDRNEFDDVQLSVPTNE